MGAVHCNIQMSAGMTGVANQGSFQYRTRPVSYCGYVQRG
jgi:hypothetical protein